MTAQHLLLLEFLRLRDEDSTRRCANELLARQRPDGLWSIYWEGEPDLAATLESYAALRLAGLSADDERLAAARRFCEERGGIGGARVFTRIWLALFGLWPWEEIPQIPPELVLMRPGLPLSVYDFACWARQTVVPLTVVLHYRPVRNLPPERACHELNLGPASAEAHAGPPQRPGAGVVRGPHRPARARARARLRGALDHRPPGARRLLGRHPAAVGLVADRARLPRARAGVALPQPRARGLEALPGRGRRPAPARGVPVAGVGHRPGAPGPQGRRGPGRRAGAPARRRVDPRARRSGSGATGPCGGRGSSRAAGPSSTTTTSTRTSTTPRSSRWP